MAEGSVPLKQWLLLDVVWLQGKILSYLKEPLSMPKGNSVSIPESEIWICNLMRKCVISHQIYSEYIF